MPPRSVQCYAFPGTLKSPGTLDAAEVLFASRGSASGEAIMQALRVALGCLAAVGLAACGGSGSGMAGGGASASAAPPMSATGTTGATGATGASTAPVTAPDARLAVPLIIASDGASRNWAKIAIRIQTVSLVPQSGSAPITLYTASPTAPPIDLKQLEGVGQLLGTVSVPAGRYTEAVVTVGANPGDVSLTSSEDPDSGFAAPLSAAIASRDIQIQDGRGSTGAMTVEVPVSLPAPYDVSASSRVQAPLQIKFSLEDPAFIQSQTPVTSDPTLWAVDFQGAVSGQSIADITELVLRQMYGTLVKVASDGKSIAITRDYPTQPVVTPETAVATTEPLTILADSGNGTEFYDIDAGTSMTASNFVALAGLTPGRFLRIAARYQSDGSLVATQIWASDRFSNVWSGPAGTVMHVDASHGTLDVEDESGHPVQVQTDASTEFDYQGTPIATGSAFLAAGPVVRGFKVRVSPRNPGSGESVAQSIDIESASFEGAISNTTLAGFTYTSAFSRRSDNYTLPLAYISPSTPNGTATNGSPILGYAYWNFAYPTEVVYGAPAEEDFQLATSGSLTAYGASLATWDDPAAPHAWGLRSTTLLPVPPDS
jgi:hypothetical protein